MTAEKLLRSILGNLEIEYDELEEFNPELIEECLKDIKEFAKYYVEQQKKAILENVNMIGVTQHNNNAPDVFEDFVYVIDNNGPDYGYTVNKESIINAYPPENIQ